MDFLKILEKKRDNKSLSYEEINFIVEKAIKKEIPDYQISAFLMATYINGMNDEETYNLTMSMVNNGNVEYIPGISDFSVDKHSTGGVGDKLTLVIGPILAAIGIPFVKMSGRGLGITGGTLDKLESITGFNINLSNEEIENQVKNIGIVIAAQSNKLAPADKIFYSLRDVTATIDSYPLIASSIMSKKLAIKNKALCIDLKVGKGAFMKDLESAEELARIFKFIAEKNERDIRIILTNMDYPIGRCVGNALEISEVLNTLKGKLKEDVYDMSIKFAAESIKLLKNDDIDIIINKCKKTIEDGSAYNKFIEMIKYQLGDVNVLNNIETLYEEDRYYIHAKSDGYVYYNANDLGYLSLMCGAGRSTKDDNIDFGAGIKFSKINGDPVKRNDLLYTIYTNKQYNDIDKYVENTFEILKERTPFNRIIKVI